MLIIQCVSKIYSLDGINTFTVGGSEHHPGSSLVFQIDNAVENKLGKSERGDFRPASIRLLQAAIDAIAALEPGSQEYQAYFPFKIAKIAPSNEGEVPPGVKV